MFSTQGAGLRLELKLKENSRRGEQGNMRKYVRARGQVTGQHGEEKKEADVFGGERILHSHKHNVTLSGKIMYLINMF